MLTKLVLLLAVYGDPAGMPPTVEQRTHVTADGAVDYNTLLTPASGELQLQLPQFVLALYSDWSVVLQSAKYVNYDVDASMRRRVDSMAAAGANTIWWTNLPDDPVQLAALVTYSRTKGIESILGSGRWYIGGWNYARTGEPITLPYRHLRLTGGERLAWRAGIVDEQFATIQRLLAAMPPSSHPQAWSLGDETPPAALPALKQLADKCRAAGVPATAVQVPEFHAETISTLAGSIPTVACDVYPFFVPGLASNPPYGAAALTRARQTYDAVIARSTNTTPLLMVQGFGDPTLFAKPTPEQVSWQTWMAAAARSPGIVVFAHGVPWTLAGNAPASLVDLPTETPTPIGAAATTAFGRLKTLAAMLPGSTVDSVPAWSMTTAAAGDKAIVLRTPGNKRLLFVIADPLQPQRTLKVSLPGVAAATPLASSTGGTLFALPWPWSIFWPTTLTVVVPPGGCWVGELR